MKDFAICPKCENQDIIRVPGSAGFTVAMKNIVPDGMSNQIDVTRFVCAQCGYSEEWIEGDLRLKMLRQRYSK